MSDHLQEELQLKKAEREQTQRYIEQKAERLAFLDSMIATLEKQVAERDQPPTSSQRPAA